MNVEDKFAVIALVMVLVSTVLAATAELIDTNHVVTKRCLYITALIVSVLGLVSWFLSDWQWGW